MRNLFLVFLFAIALSSCSNCSRNDAMDRITNLKDSMNAVIEAEMMRAELRQAREERLRFMIDSITTQDYMYENNVFSNVYMHNTWKGNPDPNRNGLLAVVYESTGAIVLVSTLPGINVPLHNRVEIQIAVSTWSADSAYTYPLTEPDWTGHIPVRNANGEVLYVLEEEARAMVEAIVANPAEEVTVRALFNDEVYASYTLSEEDKQAIIAAFRLHLLITELRELEASDVEFDD